MPSQTFIVRAHARTIYTRPITFVCARCQQMTTRECYPGKAPIYCLICAPSRRSRQKKRKMKEKGMFSPSHYLISGVGKKTEVCLEKSDVPGWYWVRTALDWFSGDSIIRYHKEKGIESNGTFLTDYTLEQIPETEQINLSQLSTPLNSSRNIQPLAQKKQNFLPPANIVNQPYSGRFIRKRFQCGDRLLKIKRYSADFPAWSKTRDPHNIAWEYRAGKFHPLNISED